MIIRCERCSTLYELDDGMLSPEGSEVQCARCQHVFTVRPPQAPGRTLQGLPAQDPAPAPPSPAASPPSPAASGQSSAQFGHRPAVYRPPPSQPAVSTPIVARAPVLRRDTVGTFESRLRWNHRWKWLAPVLLAVVAGSAVALFLLRGPGGDDHARLALQRARTLAAADDLESLEQARREVQAALQASPRLHAARADGALVDLLLAGALAEAPGEKEKGDLKARRERSRALAEAAGQVLEELRKADVARPEVARARAVAASFGGSRAELHRLAQAAQRDAPADPWPALAEASADVRGGDRAARDRALVDLAALAAQRPELLRARYLLARGQALAGHRAEALATLEALLRDNPKHENARALQELVSRPPASAPIAPALTTTTAAATSGGAAKPEKAEKPATLPRKPESAQPTVDGSTAPSTPSSAPPATAEPTGPGDVPPSPEPAPRLRPAAVPEPEPVRGGG